MPVALSGGTGIHWQEQGSGTPVLLVGGLGGTAGDWWRLLRGLPPGLRAITFDHRGTGRSGPAEVGLTLTDLVGDALSVLDDAGVRRAHLVGSSMGGMIAQQLALDHRERVASLVLLSTTAVARRGSPPWRLLGAGALRPWLGGQRSQDLATAALYARRTREEHPELVAEDAAARDGHAPGGRTLLAHLAAVSGHDVAARLAELEGLGVTVLHGTEDELIAPDRARELAAAIAGAELVLLPDCGHMVTTDAERPATAALLAHLARHAGGDG